MREERRGKGEVREDRRGEGRGERGKEEGKGEWG